MSTAGAGAPAAGPGPLNPQVQAIVDADPTDNEPGDLVAVRGAYAAIAERLGGSPPTVAAVADDTVTTGAVPPVPVRVCRPDPPAAGRAGVVVFCHGGGWQLGDLDGFDRVARALCAGSGHHVVSVEYRLAPEHPFPAARDDVVAVLDWASGPGAAAYGWDGRHVVLAGDSAGAQLAILAGQARPEAVCGQVLGYPALDPWCAGASYTTFEHGPMLTREVMVTLWADYLAATDPDDPALTVLRPGGAGLAAAPSTLVVLASHDVLRDDGLAYAAALGEVGVPVEVRDCAGTVHGFLRWAGAVDAAGEALAAMGAFAGRRIAERRSALK